MIRTRLFLLTLALALAACMPIQKVSPADRLGLFMDQGAGDRHTLLLPARHLLSRKATDLPLHRA